MLGPKVWIQDRVRVAQAHPEHHHGEKLSLDIEKHNNCVTSYRENVDEDAWDRHHAMLSHHSLAKQGNPCAVDELVIMAKKQNQKSQNALESLAEQWNRQALEALINMA